MQHFYERRDASPHYMPSHSQVQTGRFAEPETNWQAGQSGTHFAACRRANPAGFTLGKQGGLEPLFACWGNLPQAPLNDFCKIGCAPAKLSSPAARQGIAAWSIFLRRTCGLHRQMTLRYLSVLCQIFGPYHEPHSPHFILPEKSWTPLSPSAVL